MNTSNKNCVLCGQLAEQNPSTSEPLNIIYKCKNCGTYSINIDLVDLAKEYFDPHELSLISHIVGRNKEKWDVNFTINKVWIEKIIQSHKLPTPKVLLDNLILWLGNKLSGFGDKYEIKNITSIAAEVGALNEDALYQIIEEAQNQNLLKEAIKLQRDSLGTLVVSLIGSLELTYRGWDYYEAIEKGEIESKLAFMAMPFGNDELDNVFVKYWKSAVEDSGFTLERLDEKATAGSIDDRLRQTIRRSSFIICELTNANNGAYWESGFAEGIGVPVIYTCKEENHKNDSHFDVNHHLCIIWNDNNLTEKSKELSSVISETFKMKK
ncbi:MAG: hypothetical protein IMY67_04130 [Bacteroidetes bacterium]|nr:hypothetical protein [Bacteroidota bacterium]